MEISKSALWEEVLETIKTKDKRLIGKSVKGNFSYGARDVHFAYECEINIEGMDEPIKPFKLLTIETSRHYATINDKIRAQYGDFIIATMMIGLGTFSKVIYPNRHKLSVTIFKTPMFELNMDDNKADKTYVERYRAHLLINKDDVLESNDNNADDLDAREYDGFKQIPFQLVNLTLDQLRLKTINTCYSDMTMFNIIRGTYTREAGLLDLPIEDKLKGVEIVLDEVNNDLIRPQTIVEAIPVMGFVDYLQNHYGVYSAGAGHYIQGRWWYVYPEFNTKRFDKSEFTMTVVNVPKNRMPQMERTYYEDGEKLFVLSTGEVTHVDELEFNELNRGNGVRFLLAHKVLNQEDNKTFFLNAAHEVECSVGDNVREFMISPRPTGFNNIPMLDKVVSSNVLLNESKITRQLGSLIRFTWENADADLIKPGMPTKFLYMDKEEIIEKMAVVVAVNFTVTQISIGVRNRYMQNASVLLFVEKEDE